MKLILICSLVVGLALWSATADELGREKNMASTILTPVLASRILSGDVEPGSSNSQPDGGFARMRISHCSYKTTAVGKQAAYLDFDLRQMDTPALAKAQFESSKIIFRGQDVSGVGEAAFRPVSPAQLHVLKGRYYIVVSAGKSKSDASAEENAVAEILRRLRD